MANRKTKLLVNGYKLASWLTWKLPPALTYAGATIGGELYYWLARQHSRNADYNMMIVLGEKQITRRVRQVARRSFRNYAKYMIDFLRQPHLSAQEIIALCTTSGWNYIEEASQQGKGVMLVTPHFGNWDGSAVVVVGHGYQYSAVAKDFDPPELNELIQGARRGKGIQIYSLKDSVRGLLSTLKNNGKVVLMLDSPLRNEGVMVKFFDRYVRMAGGPGTLVYRTGSRVVLGYIVRQPGNRSYYGCWEPPLQYELNGERDHDIEAITQAIATAIEKLVRRHPDQWYMFRSLFLSDEEVAEHQRQAAERARNKPARRPRQTAEDTANIL